MIQTKHVEYSLIIAVCISICLSFSAISQEGEYELNKPENRQILDDVITREVEPKINLKAHFVWLATTTNDVELAGSNGIGWNDLDLTSSTSSSTLSVILKAFIKHSATGVILSFRKNGKTPTYFPEIRNQVANIYMESQVLVGCDSEQKIEWKSTQVNTDNILISVVGYWEQSK